MSSPVPAILWFLVIVAAIPLALWLLKRTPVGGAGAGGGLMRSVAVLPISASQRLVTVEVGHGEQRCWIVLGVTQASITTLYTMLPQDDAGAAPPNPGTAFAQLIGRLRGNDHAN